MTDAVELRPARPQDAELLFRVYASTRAEELSVVAWDDEQKEAFLRAQFDAQDRWYREHYERASFDVVLIGGEPGGRLYVAPRRVRDPDRRHRAPARVPRPRRGHRAAARPAERGRGGGQAA